MTKYIVIAVDIDIYGAWPCRQPNYIIIIVVIINNNNFRCIIIAVLTTAYSSEAVINAFELPCHTTVHSTSPSCQSRSGPPCSSTFNVDDRMRVRKGRLRRLWRLIWYFDALSDISPCRERQDRNNTKPK